MESPLDNVLQQSAEADIPSGINRSSQDIV
jgi:hypothetical protein